MIAISPWAHMFNSPLECGIRAAALLRSAYPKVCDLQRLVQYDYLVVHSGDVEGGPLSIHPATPHRSGELLVRRSLVKQGIEFMTTRLVIEPTFTAHGIGYVAGEYASVFFDALTTKYSQDLCRRADWVVGRFQDMPDAELGEYMRGRWKIWGAEFVRESLFEGSAE